MRLWGVEEVFGEDSRVNRPGIYRAQEEERE